ncbi:Plexin-B1 Semaphorin receptor SEP [Takifugu flavidus]|uniref:Plexin-B1 Semaphorin receptor SEP n=1 Tax=Takifugu flavidus TaxID=433684 RepID=A0A5C6MPI4_9TELE|nr:Plexin-B1 Semaphorin receptor SEP [Takifugu flavidus]
MGTVYLGARDRLFQLDASEGLHLKQEESTGPVGQGSGREMDNLLGVFSSNPVSANKNPLDSSALCIYPLDELDQHFDSTRDLCYSKGGHVRGKGEVAYIEYEVKSSCANLPLNTVKAYPCGSDHTPSPMASRKPQEAKAVLEIFSHHLTAVAVSVRKGHSIAFLGDTKGTLHKVFHPIPIHWYKNAPSQNVELTWTVGPVCLLETLTVDGVSCRDDVDSIGNASRDLCRVSGFGVSTRHNSVFISIILVSITSVMGKKVMYIIVSVKGLPNLGKGEAYSCFFKDAQTQALFTTSGVICPTPDADSLPPIDHGDEFVVLTLSLRFMNVIVAETEFTFYNCSLVQQLSGRRPCQGCVSSRWGCNWCIHQHVCTHKQICSKGVTIFNRNECPSVERVQGSSLLPVSVERKITLLAKHLNVFQDKSLDYECVLEIENQSVVVDAAVEPDINQPSVFLIKCQPNQYLYSVLMEEYTAMIIVRRKNKFRIDSAEDLYVNLFNCSVGRQDCSRCHTADPKYGCVWCNGASASGCVYQGSCNGEVQVTCPAPVIHFLDPLSGPVEGGTVVTISGSNLGQRAEDVQNSVTVAGIPCSVINSRYEVSSKIVCVTARSGQEKIGQALVKVQGGGLGLSAQIFSFQNPVLSSISPRRGPRAGGSSITIRGWGLRTGHSSEVSVLIGEVPCMVLNIQEDKIICVTSGCNRTGDYRVTVHFGGAERHLLGSVYHYTPNPNITMAAPTKSFLSGGRIIRVSGQNLDVVQEPKMRVILSPPESLPPRRKRRLSSESGRHDRGNPLKKQRRTVPNADCFEGTLCHLKQYESQCCVNSSTLITCPSPAVGSEARRAKVKVLFLMDSLHFDFTSVGIDNFNYEPNPKLYPLNRNNPTKPYHHKPGSIISVEGENLDLAIYKHEVQALIGEGVCSVKTLTHNNLYCEPPVQQPSIDANSKQEGMDNLPEFTVKMGNLNFSLGRVKYDSQAPSIFPVEAQVGVGVGASIVALIVLIIVLIYRRKSKQAMRDYKKVQIQLENLETSVRDRCKKEFTDLMTEMMDMSSDLVGSGIPFLDYRAYIERIFFPSHQESPLRRNLDVPENRRQTVEQGLVQLSNLLNSKLFLTKFIHTLEVQRTFSPRDRAYVASLLTVALHGKLEYFTDILKTLLNDLVEQYVAKNPKLMLRRTESVVEKLLTNWMSVCLFTFLQESAGESFYMLFRAIKHQVDKGPVDVVTGKAKYTLNDNRLLREDVEYRTLTLNVVIPAAATCTGATSQIVPAKVLDCDTITQVKEKLVEQTWKGTSFSQRPHIDSLQLEWRAGVAGHLILSDEDLTSVVQGSWKRLNTLQHYKVPDGATMALVLSKHHLHDSHDYMPGEKTPALDDGEEEGVRLWHLVKAREESELPKHRKGSVRERGGERAKAIPEIYLTRLLFMKGTLQKFVDDLFTAILSTSRPVPLAVKYFFDLLDEQALQHGITDPEIIHIWKTNSLPLRFWINILKNPQFIFDVQTSDHVDAVLSVIAQTFMDSCTIADHKLGRDSPINKLLYARDIPRYKQMVERYYADIRQTIPASDQEMNSSLAEISRNYTADINCLVALHDLYKYINKYYDQIITTLEEDTTAQKMQLGYRLQQIAAAVENKVTDL